MDEIFFPEQRNKSEEMNYKKNFCLKYFDKNCWDFDVLEEVDILLKRRNGKTLLYIESKHKINSTNYAKHRRALAQVILTNHKQKEILDHVAIIYVNEYGDDILEYIDCSDDAIMYNNDINWEKEKPSNPSPLAVNSINDRLKGKIIQYRNEEIKEFYKDLKKNANVQINITEKNVILVYKRWEATVHFKEKIHNEQDKINLFFADLLNGTKYHDTVIKELKENTLFGTIIKGKEEVDGTKTLVNEGTNLYNYEIQKDGDLIKGITYVGAEHTNYYRIDDAESYNYFWKTYHRPPEKKEFLKILEHSSKLYTEKYRRDNGEEYTPPCFVELQNEILHKHYNMNEYIVCDPCSGVGNLENQFGKDYKDYCYLSTLDPKDVDTCKIKGFENSILYDYLKDTEQPKWMYKGNLLSINDISKIENRKLMVIMNPPYTNKKGFKYDLAIEFFIKVLKMKPDVIVYYCKTEFFLREKTLSVFVNSKYKIVSHVFSNAEDTFKLSKWSVSQVIFDKECGLEINPQYIEATRYDYDKKEDKLFEVKQYKYDNKRRNLIESIEEKIVEGQKMGLVLGQWSYLGNVLIVSNGGKEKTSKITTENLKYCLLSKGINFNTHPKYFEWNYLVYRGEVNEIPMELFNDAIMFSLFYKNNNFSNKEVKNYIMPFTSEELGCSRNELNVMIAEEPDLFRDKDCIRTFDFRDFLKQFEFSEEAKALYNAALEIFKYYHSNENYINKNYNDSYYDITNAIMHKDISKFKELEKPQGKKIAKVKTTKGSKGFSKNNIKSYVPDESLKIFENFFEVREKLAKKINKELFKNKLLLWERENIF